MRWLRGQPAAFLAPWLPAERRLPTWARVRVGLAIAGALLALVALYALPAWASPDPTIPIPSSVVVDAIKIAGPALLALIAGREMGRRKSKDDDPPPARVVATPSPDSGRLERALFGEEGVTTGLTARVTEMRQRQDALIGRMEEVERAIRAMAEVRDEQGDRIERLLRDLLGGGQ